jgi:predicted DCC family thiol-disulfide oxidoreductase YuxK
MKTLVILLITVASASAATLSIDIPTADVPRIQAAFGSIYNLGRPATQTDIENAVRAWLRDSTYDYERRNNMTQFTPPPVTFTPAPTPTPTAAAAVGATPTPKKKK